MSDAKWSRRLADWVAWNHEEVDASVRAVEPAFLRTRPSRTAPSVAFHAWHIARWADRHAAAMSVWLNPSSAESEVWVARGFTERWGLTGVELGEYGGTGAGLDDDASAALPLPERELLLEYVTEAFQALEAVLGRVDHDAILERHVVDLYGDDSSIGDVILNHLSHADRHLGMIEALRGVLGERGTATE